MPPRILYLTAYQPDRATGAAEIRSRSIARALANIGEVECVVVSDPEDAESMPADTPIPVQVRDTVPVSRRPNATLRSKLRWLVEPRFEYPHGCGVSRRDMQRVTRTAKAFDLIWFYKLRTANMFPCFTWERSVVDIDDVPSAYEHTLMNASAAAVERLSSRLRAISWQRRERLLGERFSVLSVCSELDRRYLQQLGIDTRLHVIPNGFDAPATMPVRRPAAPPRLGFIGLCDYEPNRIGIEWFARDCWPLIKQEVPDARLRLVGRGSDGALKRIGPDVDGLGWLRTPDAEMATWSATIVPIQLGAGTRGKIAHAFSQKCPVVATALGAYGYDVHSGKELLIAESAADFAAACVRLMRDPALGDALAERAWAQFLNTWTWEAIRPRVWAAAEDGLRRSRQSSLLVESGRGIA